MNAQAKSIHAICDTFDALKAGERFVTVNGSEGVLERVTYPTGLSVPVAWLRLDDCSVQTFNASKLRAAPVSCAPLKAGEQILCHGCDNILGEHGAYCEHCEEHDAGYVDDGTDPADCPLPPAVAALAEQYAGRAVEREMGL